MQISEQKQTFIFDNSQTDKREIYWVDMQPPFRYNGDLVQVIDIRWKRGDMIHADTITLTLKGFKNNMKAFLLGGKSTYGILKKVVKNNDKLRSIEQEKNMELKGLSKIEAMAFRGVLKEQGKTSEEVIREAVIKYIEDHFDALTAEGENA